MSRALPLLALPLLLLGGCAAETRYRITSFLFDGVPPPAGPQEAVPESPPRAVQPDEAGREPAGAAQEPAEAGPAASPKPEQATATAVAAGSTHKPFGDRSCASCHDARASNRLRQEGNDLCFSCHKAIITGKRVVHVPALAECLLCHRPHQSENVRLLQQPLPDMCLMCHAREDMLAVHGEIGECLSCHNPHESDEDRLLEFK